MAEFREQYDFRVVQIRLALMCSQPPTARCTPAPFSFSSRLNARQTCDASSPLANPGVSSEWQPDRRQDHSRNGSAETSPLTDLFRTPPQYNAGTLTRSGSHPPMRHISDSTICDTDS